VVGFLEPVSLFATASPIRWRLLEIVEVKSRAKHLCLIIAVQMACVAVGLCIHHTLVISLVNRTVAEKAWTNLKAGAGELVLALREREFSNLAPGSPEAESIRELVRSKRSSQQQIVTIVDSEWRILFDEPSTGSDPASSRKSGRTVSWSKLPSVSLTETEPRYGSLQFPGQRHIALAYELNNPRGYILIHQPIGNIAVAPAVIAKSLLTAGGITFLWTCALLGIATYMLITRLYEMISQRFAKSEAEAIRREQTLIRTRDAVIFGLANLADSRDSETGAHLERIALYASILASALRRHCNYRRLVSPAFVRLIKISSVLHDIGKVGIGDAILLKRGRFTEAERTQMQNHTKIGGKCLKEIEQRLGTSNFLQMAREIALYHHENWDGSGYPTGLAGEQIPLAARIIAVVDVYEALSSKRIYKEPLPHEQCVAVIRSEAGKRFDPGLVEVFLEVEARFRDVARQYGTPSPPSHDRSLTEQVATVNQETEELLAAGIAGSDGQTSAGSDGS